MMSRGLETFQKPFALIIYVESIPFRGVLRGFLSEVGGKKALYMEA